MIKTLPARFHLQVRGRTVEVEEEEISLAVLRACCSDPNGKTINYVYEKKSSPGNHVNEISASSPTYIHITESVASLRG